MDNNRCYPSQLIKRLNRPKTQRGITASQWVRKVGEPESQLRAKTTMIGKQKGLKNRGVHRTIKGLWTRTIFSNKNWARADSTQSFQRHQKEKKPLWSKHPSRTWAHSSPWSQVRQKKKRSPINTWPNSNRQRSKNTNNFSGLPKTQQRINPPS